MIFESLGLDVTLDLVGRALPVRDGEVDPVPDVRLDLVVRGDREDPVGRPGERLDEGVGVCVGCAWLVVVEDDLPRVGRCGQIVRPRGPSRCHGTRSACRRGTWTSPSASRWSRSVFGCSSPSTSPVLLLIVPFLFVTRTLNLSPESRGCALRTRERGGPRPRDVHPVALPLEPDGRRARGRHRERGVGSPRDGSISRAVG